MSDKVVTVPHDSPDGTPLADFIVTKPLTLTDDDLLRMARRDEFDLVVLERRGLKLVKSHVPPPRFTPHQSH